MGKDKFVAFQMTYKDKTGKAEVLKELDWRVKGLSKRHKGKHKVYFKKVPFKKSYYVWMKDVK